jgi:hypothetical protein
MSVCWDSVDETAAEIDPMDLTSGHLEVLLKCSRLLSPMDATKLQAMGMTVAEVRVMEKLGWMAETRVGSQRGGHRKTVSLWSVTDDGLAVVRMLVQQSRGIAEKTVRTARKPNGVKALAGDRLAEAQRSEVER